MPKISPRLQRTLHAAVSLVSLGAVAWWISRQDAPRFPGSATGWLWLIGALGAYAVAVTLRGWRWHRIMRLAHIPHARSDAYGLTLVGYMGNTVLPARGGELLRIALLGARTTSKRREVLGSILAERLLDAAVLAGLFVVFTWAGVAGAPAGQAPAILAAVALVLGATALAVYLALRRRGRFERFAERVRPVARASKIFARPSGLPLAAISAVVWLLEGVTLLLIGRALGFELPLFDAAMIIVLASLAAAVPAAPGYAGTFDAGMVLGLHAANIEGGAAVGFLVLARCVMFVPVTLAGLGMLMGRYGGLRAGRREARPTRAEPELRGAR